MNEVRINDLVYAVPASWDEMDTRQALLCYGVLRAEVPGLFEPGIYKEVKRIQMLKCLLNVGQEFFDAWAADCERAFPDGGGKAAFMEEFGALLETMDFFFKKEIIERDEDADPHRVDVREQADYFSIRLGLTKCPWPKLTANTKKAGKVVFYAPKDAWENLTVYELTVAFSLLEEYIKSKDRATAVQLLATMYRPAKDRTPENLACNYDGDIRRPLQHHETTVPHRLKYFEKLPEEVVELLVFWSAGCRQRIVDSFPKIFKKPDEVKEPNRYGWASVLFELSQKDLTKLDDVGRQPFANALTLLSYLEDDRRRQEEEMERERRKRG